MVRDGTYLSARWPGDAHLFAREFAGMLERAGFETSYDLSGVIGVATWMSELLGKPPAASVSRAGLFPMNLS